MLNDDKLFRSGFNRFGTVRDGSITMMSRWVTIGHDDQKTVMGR
jgi:hypothetical protein